MSDNTTQAAPVVRRYRDALSAQGGACNALALANALVSAIRETRAENGTERTDAPCRLIAHQLAFLLKVHELDTKSQEYDSAMRICEEHHDKALSPHCLPVGLRS